MFNDSTIESGGGGFTIHPQGTYSAVCVCVIDLGTQLVKSAIYGDKQKRLVRIAFETSELIQEPGDYQGKPYLAQSQFTLSSHENGLLRPFIEGWRGQKYASETDCVKGLSRMDRMVGYPAMLNIVHSDCGKYANIASASPLMKGVEPLTPVMDTVIFSLDKPDWTMFEKLTEKTKQKISESKEYQSHRPNEPVAAPQQQQQQNIFGSNAPQNTGAPAIDFDDEIPF